MEVDFSGDYLKADPINDGKIATVLNEGKFEYSDTLKKEMFNIDVELEGKKKIWSPSSKHGALMQKTFGMDTKEWVGKQFEIMIIEDKMMIRPIVTQRI